MNPPFLSIARIRGEVGTAVDVATVRGYPAASLSTDNTPGDLMLRNPATLALYVMLPMVMPLAASIVAAPNDTVAVMAVLPFA